MLRLLLLALLAACGGSSPAPRTAVISNTPTGEPPDAPRPIAGAYSAPHTIQLVCHESDEGWCEEEVSDEMTIRDAGGGRIDVAIELVQTNAHTCTFEGTLAPDPAAAPADRRWTFSSNDDVEGPCKVTLTAGADGVELDSEGCRYYCGARAHLASSFPYPK
jgi:hypothetical protein